MVNGGKFTKVKAKPDWRKGDIITLKDKTNNFKAFYAAAACFLVLLIGAIGGHRIYYTETSLVSMDINPSLEFSINSFGRVISVTSYNKDAEKLLKTEKFKGLSYQKAIDTLLKSDAMLPYLDNNSYLDFAVYSKTNDTKVLEYLNSCIQSITDLYPEIQVNCSRADKVTVSNAHDCHMSLGKYLAFLKLQEIEPNLEANNYTHCGIGEIRQQIRRHHQDEEEPETHLDKNEAESECPYNDGDTISESNESSGNKNKNNSDDDNENSSNEHNNNGNGHGNGCSQKNNH